MADERTKQVQEYIKKYRSSGYSDEKISQALLRSKIDPALVTRLLSKKPLTKQWWVWTLLVLLLLIGAYFLVFVLPDLFVEEGIEEKAAKEKIVTEEVSEEKIVAEEVGAECTVDADCEDIFGDGFQCLFGTCSVFTGSSGGSSGDSSGDVTATTDDAAETVECSSDTDCSDGNVCSSDSVCVESVECSSDTDCSDGNVCTDGACIEVATAECTSDTDCSDGNVCSSDSACVESVECSSDTDCSDGNVCTDGACIEVATAECTSDADCASGFVCSVDGACEAEAVITACDSDCAPYACDTTSGTCETSCDYDGDWSECADMADGYGCALNDVCVGGSEITITCSEDDTDPDGYGYIVTAAGTTTGTSYYDGADASWTDFCTADGELVEYWCPGAGEAFEGYAYGKIVDCSADSVCTDGACVVAAEAAVEEVIVECSVDEDCDVGEICFEGVCVVEEEIAVIFEEELVCTDALPTCADGVDNDDNGVIDREDEDCTSWDADEGEVVLELGQACTSNQNCTGGYRCDTTNSVCYESCTVDTECKVPLGYSCVSSECTSTTDAAILDGTALPRPTAGASAPTECVANSQCATSEACDGYLMECIACEDSDAGTIDIGSAQFRTQGTVTGVKYNSGASSSHVETNTDSCSSTTEIKEYICGGIIQGGAMHNFSLYGLYDTTVYCGTGYVCENGACVLELVTAQVAELQLPSFTIPATTGEACTSNQDCTGGYRCDTTNSVCYESCTVDTECKVPLGYSCVSSECKSTTDAAILDGTALPSGFRAPEEGLSFWQKLWRFFIGNP